jgi:hypothetical protein
LEHRSPRNYRLSGHKSAKDYKLPNYANKSKIINFSKKLTQKLEFSGVQTSKKLANFSERQKIQAIIIFLEPQKMQEIINFPGKQKIFTKTQTTQTFQNAKNSN